MQNLTKFILVTLIVHSNISFSQKPISIHSPDKNLKLTIQYSISGQINYQLSYKNKIIIEPSLFGYSLNKPEILFNKFQINSIDSTEFNDTWKPVLGEVSEIRNHYKSLIIYLQQKENVKNLLNIEFRIFNDGVGFRYDFPSNSALKHIIVKDELTQFNLAGDHKTFWIPGDYDTNEYLYNTTKLSEINALNAAAKEPDIALKSVIGKNTVQTPLMMKTSNGIYINIHEAALINYPAMNLTLDKANFTFLSHLVPDAVGNKVYITAPFKTPWRTIIISDKSTDILASKLILNLNEPSKITDVSWIKPQKFIGVWWEMHTNKGSWDLASGKHAANTANVKKYIDFASQHGFDGVLVEGWNKGWEDWFGNWKEDVFDFTSPYPDYDLKELSNYAAEKNIKLIMHHETAGSATSYEQHIDAAYKLMNDNGINTVKTGYVGRIIPRGEHHDSQWMVNHYNRVAQKAAEYKIMIEAHEPVHPTGLHRTYPNWLSNEAGRGNEFNNAPTLGLVPEHETIMPFTRLMGGPMDYTPGFFQFQLNQYDKTRKTSVKTTLAKQLALYITMYSPLQMAGDLPENFEKYLNAFQFIKDVPTDWDDTKILAAEPGEYITIARKQKGKHDWYLGAITDENSRNAVFKLDFLDKNDSYEATIYKDKESAHWKTNPAAYEIEKRKVNQNDILNVNLAAGGGCAISLKKIL